LAQTNIENEKTVAIFCSSIKTLKQQMETNTLSQTNDSDFQDYQVLMEELMEQERLKRASSQLAKRRASQASQIDDDDDDE
jgi:hypothetical protein